MAQTSRLRSLSEGELPPDFGAGADPNLLFGNSPQAPPSPPPSQPAGRVENAATSMLLTSLRALSQRTLIALSQLFVLVTAASAFWLWYVTMPAPSVPQLVGLSLYGALVLVLNWMVLRRR